MALTEGQQQAIRDEEFFRHEVRNELAGRKPPPNLFTHISNFFETKAGFWILTTVLAGVTVTGFSTIDRWLHREEIENSAKAEKSRRDTDTLIKLGPMMTSEAGAQRDVAIILLNGLASSNAIDTPLVKQVTALFQKTAAAGANRDATSAETAEANSVVSFADQERVTFLRTGAAPDSSTVIPVSQALDNASLPARIYIQIPREQDRAATETAAKAMRKAGLLVPGIEVVGPNRSPGQTDLRYCETKTDPATIARVQAALAYSVSPPPKPVALPAKACTKVRTNHFEIWYARPSEPK